MNSAMEADFGSGGSLVASVVAAGWRNRAQRLLRQALQRRTRMKAKYFPDTDTFLLQFSDAEIAETYDLNENVLVEVDKTGRLVSMTVEHAKEQMDVSEFSYQLAM